MVRAWTASTDPPEPVHPHAGSGAHKRLDQVPGAEDPDHRPGPGIGHGPNEQPLDRPWCEELGRAVGRTEELERAHRAPFRKSAVAATTAPARSAPAPAATMPWCWEATSWTLRGEA